MLHQLPAGQAYIVTLEAQDSFDRELLTQDTHVFCPADNDPGLQPQASPTPTPTPTFTPTPTHTPVPDAVYSVDISVDNITNTHVVATWTHTPQLEGGYDFEAYIYSVDENGYLTLVDSNDSVFANGYAFTGLTPYQKYLIRVNLNIGGTIVASDTIIFTTEMSTPTPTPTVTPTPTPMMIQAIEIQLVQITETTAGFTWDSYVGSDEDTIRYRVGIYRNGLLVNLESILSTTNFSETNLSDGTDYQFRVQVLVNGSVHETATLNFTTVAYPTPTPTATPLPLLFWHPVDTIVNGGITAELTHAGIEPLDTLVVEATGNIAFNSECTSFSIARYLFLSSGNQEFKVYGCSGAEVASYLTASYKDFSTRIEVEVDGNYPLIVDDGMAEPQILADTGALEFNMGQELRSKFSNNLSFWTFDGNTTYYPVGSSRVAVRDVYNSKHVDMQMRSVADPKAIGLAALILDAVGAIPFDPFKSYTFGLRMSASEGVGESIIAANSSLLMNLTADYRLRVNCFGEDEVAELELTPEEYYYITLTYYHLDEVAYLDAGPKKSVQMDLSDYPCLANADDLLLFGIRNHRILVDEMYMDPDASISGEDRTLLDYRTPRDVYERTYSLQAAVRNYGETVIPRGTLVDMELDVASLISLDILKPDFSDLVVGQTSGRTLIATDDQQYALANSDLPLGGTEYIGMRSGDPLNNSRRVQTAVMTSYTDLELPVNGATTDVESVWDLTMKFWIDAYPQLVVPQNAQVVNTFEANAALGLDKFSGSLTMELQTDQQVAIVSGDQNFGDALSLDENTTLSRGSIDLMEPGDAVTIFQRVWLDSYAAVELQNTEQYQYGIDAAGSPYFVIKRTTGAPYTFTADLTTLPLRAWTTLGVTWTYGAPTVTFYISGRELEQANQATEPVNLIVADDEGNLSIGPGVDGLLMDNLIILEGRLDGNRFQALGDIYHTNQIGGPGVVWFLEVPNRYEGGGFRFGLSGDGRYVIDYLIPEYEGVSGSSRAYFDDEEMLGHQNIRFVKDGTRATLYRGDTPVTITLADELPNNTTTDYLLMEADLWSSDKVINYNIDLSYLQLAVDDTIFASSFGTLGLHSRDLDSISYLAVPESHLELENSRPVVYRLDADPDLLGLAFIDQATAVVKEYTPQELVRTWYRGNLDFSRVDQTNDTEFPISQIFRSISEQDDGPLTPEFLGLMLMATIGMVGGIFAGRAQGGGLAVSIMAFFIVFGFFLDLYPLWVAIWAAIAAMGTFFGNRLRAGGSL